MMQKMDIQDCMIYLETKGISDEEIIEKMDCNKTTVQRWWKSNKATPKYLAKMQKWCGLYVPIEDHFYGKRPPEDMFREALETALIDCKDEAYQIKWQLRYHSRNFGFKNYYDNGIPAAHGHRTIQNHPFKSYYHKDRPSIETIRRVCADYHPDIRVRDYFTTEINKAEARICED